jgi:hypothetical protein
MCLTDHGATLAKTPAFRNVAQNLLLHKRNILWHHSVTED